MRKTGTVDNVSECKTVDIIGLQQLLSVGKRTAAEIGTAAGARIQVGRRVLWNVGKIQKYLDSISE